MFPFPTRTDLYELLFTQETETVLKLELPVARPTFFCGNLTPYYNI